MMTNHEWLQTLLKMGKAYREGALLPFVNQIKGVQINELDTFLKAQRAEAIRYDALLQCATELAVSFKEPLFRMHPFYRSFALGRLRSDMQEAEQWELDCIDYAHPFLPDFVEDTDSLKSGRVEDKGGMPWPVGSFKEMLSNMVHSYKQMLRIAEEKQTETSIREGALALRQFDYYFTQLKLLMLSRVSVKYRSFTLAEKERWIHQQLESIVPVDGHNLFTSIDSQRLDSVFKQLPDLLPHSRIFPADLMKPYETNQPHPDQSASLNSWLFLILGSKQLGLGTFLLMVLGTGFIMAGLVATLGSGGMALGPSITLLGGGGAMLALGAAGYSAGFFVPKKNAGMQSYSTVQEPALK